MQERKPKAYFASISPPKEDTQDPNIVNDIDNWENRNFIRTKEEKEYFNQQYDLAQKRSIQQGGLIKDPKLTKNRRIGRLIDDTVFQHPYPKSYLARLGNAYEFDSIVRVGIDTIVHYILGRDFEPMMVPVTRAKPKIEKEFDEILNDILEKKKREDFLDKINYIDHIVKLKTNLKSLITSELVYGRGAGYIVRASDNIESNSVLGSKLGLKENTPMHIKPLDSYYLGQNHYDKRSWEIESIEYDNPNWEHAPGNENEPTKLKMDDLIYLPNNDYGIIPNSHGYGMSALESILSLSGANRRINEKVLPELNTTMWAGAGIFKFTGMSAKQMNNFVNTVLPSTWKATNQEIEYIPIKLDYDGKFILEQRTENVKQIATQLRIPSFLINFEDVTNRSIGDRVSNIWQQGDLEFRRDELRDQLWESWYRKLMELYLGEEEFLYIRAKILIEFQSIDFSNFFEKAIAGGNLVQNMIFSRDEVRELLGKPPFTEDQQAFLDNVERFLQENPDVAQNIINQSNDMMKIGQNPNDGSGQNPNQKSGGTIGQQGLSANINNQKIRGSEAGGGNVTKRIKKGLRDV